MTIQLIPDSAPFDTEQKAWLNGFLAGVLGVAEAVEASGNAMAVSGEVTSTQPVVVEEDEDFSWHDPDLSMDERMELAEGKTRSNKLMAAMAQLDCGSCGYLCQTYAEALDNGSESNTKLCVPGAKDTAKMLKKIMAESPADAIPDIAEATITVGGEEVPGYSRHHPYKAKVIKCENLNGESSAKHTSHVEIDLTGSDLSYEVGDALGVYPKNCPELVNDIISSFGMSADTQVTGPRGQSGRLDEVMIHQCDLRYVEDELLELCAEHAVDDLLAKRMRGLVDSDELDGLDVLDIAREFKGVSLEAETFLATLNGIQPRLYSIASSIKKHPGQVHLTIGRAVTQTEARLYKGVCSTMFADRMQAGDEVEVFVQPAHAFYLTPDLDKAIIMVGPGTGIAPFRAFLEEREATSAGGDNWLFFGDQTANGDFLYEEEIKAWQESGVLNKLDLAFSRDQAEKIYVQHRMIEAASELYQWLEAGACFYVCGDASRMAKDVDLALKQVIAQESGCSMEDAESYVKRMSDEHRYMRDVY